MMIAFGIRYLTGYVVASAVSSRDTVEWPPHPARIFMAMAAAMFETGEDSDERESLMWLERQGSPALRVNDAQPRNVPTCYVPVNDTSSPIKKNNLLPPLQSAAIGRDRQPRTFPKTRPTEEALFLVWADSNPSEKQRCNLQKICHKVSRIGHSSSLVQMWVEEAPPPCNLIPCDLGDVRLRVASPGTLSYLEDMANFKALHQYEELSKEIAILTAEKKAIKGEEGSKRKEEIQQKINVLEQQRKTLHPRPSQRPVISQWQGYRWVEDEKSQQECASGAFDKNILVLTLCEGPVVGLETSWRLMTALHKTILAQCDPVPEWVSGHTSDYKASESPHLALFPLAYVGGGTCGWPYYGYCFGYAERDYCS